MTETQASPTPASAPQLPTSQNDLMEILKTLGIETETATHKPLFTVEDSKDVHLQVEGAHTKNLFVKDKKGVLFLIVAEHSTQIRMNHLHKVLECGRLSFGKPDLLFEHLGITPGSVSAFCTTNDKSHNVNLVFDAKLMEHEIINCHPMTNEATTSIKRADLFAFFAHTGHEPRIVDLEAALDA